MNVESLQQAETEIRQMVEATYVDERGKADPIFDGVVNAERYIACPIKMLWILKEPWDGEDSSGGGWSMCENQLATWPVSDLSQSTFHPIIYITYGIIKRTWDYDSMPWVSKMPEAQEMIRSIAFINAKKLPGVTRGARHPTVMHWFQKGAHIIDRQIEVYSPRIIFGCAPHFREIILRGKINPNAIRSHRSVNYVHEGDRLYVEVYHPGQTQIERKDYVNDVLAIVSQLFSDGQARSVTPPSASSAPPPSTSSPPNT